MTVYANEYITITTHAYNDKCEVVLNEKNAKILIGTNKRNAAIEISNNQPSIITIGKLTVVNCDKSIIVHSYNLYGVQNYENPLRLIDNTKKSYYVKIEFVGGENQIITGRFNKIPEDKMHLLLPITIKRYAKELLYYLDYIIGEANMVPLQPWRTEQILIYMCKHVLKKRVRGDIDDFVKYYHLLIGVIDNNV